MYFSFLRTERKKDFATFHHLHQVGANPVLMPMESIVAAKQDLAQPLLQEPLRRSKRQATSSLSAGMRTLSSLM
jgi:hypothetical protein